MNISLKILLLLISSVIFTWIFVLHVPKGGGGQFHSVIYVVLRTFFAAKKCATLLHVVTIHLHVWLDNSSKHSFKFTARLTTWYRVDSLLGITVIYIHAFNYRLLLWLGLPCLGSWWPPADIYLYINSRLAAPYLPSPWAALPPPLFHLSYINLLYKYASFTCILHIPYHPLLSLSHG